MGKIRKGAGPLAVLADVDLGTGEVHQRMTIARAKPRDGYFDARFSDDASTLVTYRTDRLQAFLTDKSRGCF
jgi:hypothetical protein